MMCPGPPSNLAAELALSSLTAHPVGCPTQPVSQECPTCTWVLRLSQGAPVCGHEDGRDCTGSSGPCLLQTSSCAGTQAWHCSYLHMKSRRSDKQIPGTRSPREELHLNSGSVSKAHFIRTMARALGCTMVSLERFKPWRTPCRPHCGRR